MDKFISAYNDCKLVAESIVDADTFQKADSGLVLGYIDTIVEALEMQVPKKPIDKSSNPKDWHIMHCPACGRIFWNSGQCMHYQPKYCEKCGQAIDWSEER